MDGGATARNRRSNRTAQHSSTPRHNTEDGIHKWYRSAPPPSGVRDERIFTPRPQLTHTLPPEFPQGSEWKSRKGRERGVFTAR